MRKKVADGIVIEIDDEKNEQMKTNDDVLFTVYRTGKQGTSVITGTRTKIIETAVNFLADQLGSLPDDLRAAAALVISRKILDIAEAEKKEVE